ncbi:hypothetical protein [Holophaga foetida]|uniref:hypothetical protein n=1 Tax=Holophaga foetida TaxID=35839 RepID=UPI0002473726|nr:hypothetical protein [Holophaga foetida]
MIISHKHKFIFIKTLKTAGTSLEIFLSQHCGRRDVVTPIHPHVEPHRARNHNGFFNHIPASAVKKQLPLEVWNHYFKFCIERNPWDKTLSHYWMERFRATGELSFDSYLSKGEFPMNHPLYTDPKTSEVMVDRIVRYENLMDELGEIFLHLGIPFNGSLNANAKGDYRLDRRHYREVYTPEQRKIIENAFTSEISTHGYQF